MKITTLTNDKALWAIRPFMQQFNKYWNDNQQVEIVGFHQPPFELLPNFSFKSIASNNWPASKWSNQLIEYLNSIPDKLVILMLEDYWLKSPVDDFAIKSMYEYAQTLDNLLRIDLTGDRSQHRTASIYHEYNGFEIVRTKQPTPYQMSYQAAIWDRENLLKVLLPEENAWQSEIDGSKRVKDDMLVLGLKEPAVSYVPVLRRNKTGLQGFSKFSQQDQNELLKLIPKDKR